MSVHKMTIDKRKDTFAKQILARDVLTNDETHKESPLSFLERRHLEKIEGSKPNDHPWRTKERVRSF